MRAVSSVKALTELTFNGATGTDRQFVQDNHSRSAKGVLYGLHYQIQQPRASWCAWCARAVFDVAVDISQILAHVWEVGKVELTQERKSQANVGSWICAWFW